MQVSAITFSSNKIQLNQKVKKQRAQQQAIGSLPSYYNDIAFSSSYKKEYYTRKSMIHPDEDGNNSLQDRIYAKDYQDQQRIFNYAMEYHWVKELLSFENDSGNTPIETAIILEDKKAIEIMRNSIKYYVVAKETTKSDAIDILNKAEKLFDEQEYEDLVINFYKAK